MRNAERERKSDTQNTKLPQQKLSSNDWLMGTIMGFYGTVLQHKFDLTERSGSACFNDRFGPHRTAPVTALAAKKSQLLQYIYIILLWKFRINVEPEQNRIFCRIEPNRIQFLKLNLILGFIWYKFVCRASILLLYIVGVFCVYNN